MEQQEFKWTAGDVARFFGISEAAAYRLAREKRLPPGSFKYLNARTLRFDLSEIKRWAADGDDNGSRSVAA
ncbi:MAG: helix-turn-helix domain-containing protein [Pyrinomonadaceae bacterium]|nr:helix-turn-helix domain-containing protein [Pyrinomonadaceae bacterium]